MCIRDRSKGLDLNNKKILIRLDLNVPLNGANIIAGSLIKNLGGTIVPTGGYIAGDSDLVEMACCRLTAPGIGSNAGINFGFGRLILQGLFLAPQMVHESLKGADLIAGVFKHLDFMVLPEPKSYSCLLYTSDAADE